MGAILKKSLKEKALAPRELYGPGRSAELYRCHENSYFPSPTPPGAKEGQDYCKEPKIKVWLWSGSHQLGLCFYTTSSFPSQFRTAKISWCDLRDPPTAFDQFWTGDSSPPALTSLCEISCASL